MTDEKLRTRIHQAIDARLSGVADEPFLVQRIAANAKGETQMKKKIAAFPAIVTAVILLTLTVAIAVEALDGRVLDWLSPAQDNVYEPSFPETTGDVSHPVADVRIHEAISDGYGVYLSVVCTPKEENVLLLNASVTPREDATMIGLTPDYPRQTIGDWADKHGYAMYDVRLYTVDSYADMSNNTCFDSAFGMTQRTEDGSVIIMMGGGSLPLETEYQLNYIITSYTKTPNGLWETDEWAAANQQRSITFSIDVPKTPEVELIAEYAVSSATPAQHINITGCRLFRTPLATYAEFVYTINDEAIAQAERRVNDNFFIVEPDVYNWTVRAYIYGREELPDGDVQFRYLTTIENLTEAPAETTVQVGLFNPNEPDDLTELLTLTRIDR